MNIKYLNAEWKTLVHRDYLNYMYKGNNFHLSKKQGTKLTDFQCRHILFHSYILTAPLLNFFFQERDVFSSIKISFPLVIPESLYERLDLSRGNRSR